MISDEHLSPKTYLRSIKITLGHVFTVLRQTIQPSKTLSHPMSISCYTLCQYHVNKYSTWRHKTKHKGTLVASLL